MIDLGYKFKITLETLGTLPLNHRGDAFLAIRFEIRKSFTLFNRKESKGPAKESNKALHLLSIFVGNCKRQREKNAKQLELHCTVHLRS